MKKLLMGFAALLCLLMPAISALAGDTVVPEEVLAPFQTKSWEGWVIPQVTHVNAPASHYYDENGRAAAMLILRKNETNVLCLLEKRSNGQWRVVTRNTVALEQGKNAQIPYIYCETYGRFEIDYAYGSSGQERRDWYVVCKESDGWHVREYRDEGAGIEVTIKDDRLIYTDTGTGKKTTVVGIYESAFSQFNLREFPKTVVKARSKLTLPPEIMGGAIGTAGMPSPQVVKFPVGKWYAIYAAPGENSYRAANGKAVLSTNDWVQVFGEEQGWLLVQYDVSSEQYRIGYMSAEALPQGTKVTALDFLYAPCHIATDTLLTDDPLISGNAMFRLPAGSEVTFLATMGSWAYVETRAPDGRLARGFVPFEHLTVDEFVNG